MVVGVGNIYVCESLIGPVFRPVEVGRFGEERSMTTRLVELVDHVKDVIEEAIRPVARRSTISRAWTGPSGISHHFAVYGRGAAV